MKIEKDARNIKIRRRSGWGLFFVTSEGRFLIDRIGDCVVSLYEKKEQAEHEARAFNLLSIDNISVGEKSPLIQAWDSEKKLYIPLKNQTGRIVTVKDNGWGLTDCECFCPSTQKKEIGSYKIDIDVYFGIEVGIYQSWQMAKKKKDEIIQAWHKYQSKKTINYGYLPLEEARGIVFRGEERYCSIPSDTTPKFEIGDIATYIPTKIQLKKGCKRKMEKVFLEPQCIEILDGPKQDWAFPTKHAKAETPDNFFYLGGHSRSEGLLYLVEMEYHGKKEKVWRNQDLFEKSEIEVEEMF